MNSVQDARIRKTLEFLENPKKFIVNIYHEIIKLQKKYGQNLVIRLNGTSDLPFENIKVVLEDRYYSNIFEAFPNVQFYDYTKNPRRALTNTIGNYYLTFSRAETKLNIEYSRNVLNEGKNVAMVFSKELHEKLVKMGKIVYNNREVNVIDGDETDLRFLDMPNSIVALKAKGKERTTKLNLDTNKDTAVSDVEKLKQKIASKMSGFGKLNNTIGVVDRRKR